MCFQSLHRGGNHKSKCQTGKTMYLGVCGDLESRNGDLINAPLEV